MTPLNCVHVTSHSLLFVCKCCLQDSQVLEIMAMLKEGFAKKTGQDRYNFGLQLKKELESFTKNFLPHMRLEEEVCAWHYISWKCYISII